MCAQCVAQGAVYAGASLTALRVMGARAKARRRARAGGDDGTDERVDGSPGEGTDERVEVGRAAR